MLIYTDFSALLTGATLLTGFFWGLEHAFLAKRRLKYNATVPESAQRAPSKFVDFFASLFIPLFFVCVFRAFLFEPFRIPTGSMRPTCVEGDFLFINKYEYGLRLPVTGTKILSVGAPQQGDIIVFRYPPDPQKMDFIKRVVAVPGDTVKVEGKTLIVNGKAVPQTFVQHVSEEILPGYTETVSEYQETLGAKTVNIYVRSRVFLTQKEITIPAGQYFVMGDNRDNSQDSRAWGLVPEEMIIGKAVSIWFSWDSKDRSVRWQRMGSSL